jgi:UDP-glucose 4-epimerase
MKKRAIVTGGAGFIGGYVIKELLLNDYEVTVVDNLVVGKAESLPHDVTFVKGDIRNQSDIETVIKEGDTIFHLAALTSIQESKENPSPYYKTNVAGTYTLLEVARKKKALGVIFSSSAAIYGNQEGVMTEETPASPESPYGLQKYIGEQLCESHTSLYGMPTICLCYFNVYGKGNKEEGSYTPVTARFLKAKREGKPLPIIGDGNQTRDFIHVEDMAQANVQAAKLL